MLTTKKRKVFSIEEKSRIIKKLNDGESNANIAKEFGITHSTVSTIWRDREKIMYYFETKSLKIKRARDTFHKDIEDALVNWVKEQRASNEVVNSRTLREKADDIAKGMGKKGFKCSTSWIQRFRGRHDLAGTRITREIEKPSVNTGEEWLPQDWLSQEWLTQDRLSDEWLTLCEGYKPDDIFNADETGLFYNMTPDKTLRYKFEQCLYGKMSKSRVTLMIAANMTGTCKHKLLVIGSKKLSIENLLQLPVNYECNNKSWMTSEIYEKWIRKWDRQLSLSDRKIVLLVDKSPIHPVIEDLYCIKIVYLPTNIPAILQPMAQGIITSLKAQYRKLQVLQMLQTIEKGGNRGLNLFDAILTLSEAWDNVTPKTIADSFHYAGFKDLTIISNPFHNHNHGTMSLVRTSPIDENSSLASDNVTLIHLIQALGSTLTLTQLEEFIEVDNNLNICATITIEEAPTRFQEKLSNNENVCEQEKITIPSLNDALGAVVTLQKFMMFNPEFNNSNNEEILGHMRLQILNAYTNHQCNKVNGTSHESTKTTS